VGSDNNLWFTEYTGHNIGRITTAGVVTEFPLPLLFQARDIVNGPNGALWFIDPQGSQYNVGTMTTSGVFTGYLMNYGTPYGIAAGPDGNVWVTAQVNGGTSSVVRITPAGVMTDFPDTNPGIPFGTPGAYAIASGSDGNIWFTHGAIAGSQGQIASLNPTSGVITEHAIGSTETGLAIVSDPTDGALWFTNQTANGVGLNRITTAGVFTSTTQQIAGIPPLAIGPDGNVWSIDQNSAALEDFAAGFVLTSYAGTLNRDYGYAYNYSGLVTGPDGNVWFTEQEFNKIGRLNTAGLFSRLHRRLVAPPRR
jgi:virginiamycin B lyase